MLYTYPDYYEKFKCVAGKCEDTCCAGWQIVIDDESVEKYKKICSGIYKNIQEEKRIDFEEKVFRQCADKRCAFLNEDNLCDMYIEWGEESFCKTCRTYPRHIEELENVREYTLSLSCPEAARIILSNSDKISFYTEEDDEDETDEEFDIFLFSLLEDARDVLFTILQGRNKSISERALLVCDMAEELQETLDEDGVFACNDVVEKYSDAMCKKSTVFEETDMVSESVQIINHYEKSLVMFRKLYEMELLNEIWADMTDEAAELVFAEGKDNYNKLHKEFEEWLDIHIKNHNIIWEQILVYFVSTYFCGAVYDGNVTGKINMSVTSLVCIYEMLLARWIKNDKELNFDDIVTVAYMYSRELEHSDINLEVMEG